jgi:hypothetical protein
MNLDVYPYVPLFVVSEIFSRFIGDISGLWLARMIAIVSIDAKIFSALDSHRGRYHALK